MDDKVEKSIRAKYVNLVDCGDRVIEAFTRKSAVDLEAGTAIIARIASGDSRDVALDGYYQTARGKEVYTLLRIATIDDQVARIMYDRAYMALRCQLDIKEGEL